MKIVKMVSMARTRAEKTAVIEQSMPAINEGPDFPYGLRISLDETDLEKLGLSDDASIDDMVHLVAIGRVCSVNKNEYNGAKSCRVEICLEQIGVEDEMEEIDPRIAKRYAKG